MKKKPKTVDFASLAQEIEAARKHLDELPDDQEWKIDELSTLDDVRHEAIHIADVIEAIIDELNGRSPS